jgi:hypothetical protein
MEAIGHESGASVNLGTVIDRATCAVPEIWNEEAEAVKFRVCVPKICCSASLSHVTHYHPVCPVRARELVCRDGYCHVSRPTPTCRLQMVPQIVEVRRTSTATSFDCQALRAVPFPFPVFPALVCSHLIVSCCLATICFTILLLT